MIKLTAKDLMIGDWVCFDGDTEHTNPVQIDGISTEEACVDGDWFDVWEPIPLTKEILEKNGWEDIDGGRGLFKEDKDYLLELSVFTDGKVWRTINGAEYIIFEIKWVHQLQHAIKLVGIEKEIVL